MRFQPILEYLPIYEAGKPIELVVREYGIQANKVIKLASNENPFGVAPAVQNKVAESVSKMPLYPDDSYHSLKSALSQKYGVPESQIIQGNGSDQIFDFATRSVLNPGDKVVQNGKTFSMYAIYSRQCGAEVIASETIEHDLDALLDLAKTQKPKILFLCTPCNPIGDALDRSDIYSFLAKIPEDMMVVLDAAYLDFAKTRDSNKNFEAKDIISKFPNVVYTGTFSKVYGLGGMRIGYGISSPEIIRAFYKLRPPFNVSQLSQLAATEALKQESFVESYLKSNLSELKKYESFADLKGLDFFESYTNFITIKLDKAKLNSSELFEKLLSEGIILRNLKSYGMNAIRITIGRPEQNETVIGRLNEIL
ncbi:histidinol-phosphate transaminase [Leptospira perolatii]|uniref:Histidinol-phosphate aminotransferase n=1 Tax=Leptospira perolatii TaxID=2023191 RepID=A0A2M9ZN93_9LEPT|nr:histidinol-phosphate transaminase [Leptospira perolatii]PJZ68933.1 histidinol-phosphate transaminase [Leptospira perolatii]PJZ73449.1 histidinol-phosphate transaminase [Leptospira perolatii]